MKKTRAAILFLCILHSPLSIGAEETGAAFLKIGAGARALGMGSAYTAAADDVTAAFWNPAGLSRLDARQVGLMHTEWIGGIDYDHLAYAHPTRRGAFAGSFARLSQGDLESRGDDGRRSGAFRAEDRALTLSIGRKLFARGSGGVNLKWVEQTIEREKAAGIAVDLGLQMRGWGNSVFAATVQNLGQRLRFLEERSRLPLSVTTGVGYRVNSNLQINADVRRLVYEERTSVNVGTEYWLLERVALRGGYVTQAGGNTVSRTSTEEKVSGLSRFSGMNLGLGLRIGSCQLDYALSPSAEFGDTHRVSVLLKL